MSLVEIIAYIVAFAGAASKLLSSTKAFWSYLPKPVSAVLPSVVLMLPYLAAQVGAATTKVDLVNAIVVSLALLLPNAHSTTDTKTETK